MTTDEAKDFDGLSLNAEDALDNMEKLIGAALVYNNTDQEKENVFNIIEYVHDYMQAVLKNIRESGNENTTQHA
ncbi:hypothetical protein B7802_07435 [Salmonella enterica]|nr:hypothetical protein [Salmonella enterica]ECW0264951.1 hypothetical protein [Salmonella enterica subsp. diarizonae]EBD5983674.1 hypothetical protein [Salmonella enterica]EBI4324798.1 hypothetical protein [Salmonella enterica]ECO4385964.1 hypothetical protein [Salmonella enterica]